MLDRLKNILLRSTSDVTVNQCLDAVLAKQAEMTVSRRPVGASDALPGRLTPVTYVLQGEPLAPIGGEFSWNPRVPLEPVSALAGDALVAEPLRTQVIDGAVRETRQDLSDVMDLIPETSRGSDAKPVSKKSVRR